MRKLKLFMAACALVGGVAVGWAQTDVTSTYLTNADFSSTEGWTQVHSKDYWSLGNGNIGTYAVANNKTSTTDATHLGTEYCLGMQCRWSTNYANFSQTTTSLPVGAYILSYDVQNTNTSTTSATYENRFNVTVGDNTYTDSKTEWMKGNSGWTEHKIEFTVEEAGTATIKLGYGTGSNNFVSGNTPHLYVSHLKLTYYPFATSDDYDNLNAAIATVEGKAWGFDAGEYAPYNYAEVLQALADAKTINQEENNNQVTIQNLTSTMNNAVWTTNDAEVNAIWDGSFEHDYSGLTGNVQPIGWYRNVGTYSNSDGTNVRYMNLPSGVEGNTSGHGLFGKFTLMYGAQPGYSLPLDEGYYMLKFTYGGWNEVGTREVKLENNENNATVQIATVTAPDAQAHNLASSYRAYSSYIKVPATGNYTLSFFRQSTNSQNQIVLTDVVLKTMTVAEATAYYNTVLDEVDDSYNAEANGGSEKTAFKNAIDANIAEMTVNQIMEAAANLYTLRDAFVAATPSYDRYVAEKANAERIDDLITSGVAVPTTKDAADAAFKTILVNEYNYVKDNYNADAAAKYGMTIDRWTGTATSGGNSDTPQTNSNEKWGESATTYYEQGKNGWGSSSWTLNYSITKTLPAGNYILKISARASEKATATLKATIGDETITEQLPNFGASGKGITTSGVASFDAGTFARNGEGYGWQWRYLAITLNEEADVTFQIDASANAKNQWCSFGDVSVLSYVDLDDLTTAYNDFNMKTLGFEKDEYAPYNNIEILEAYARAKAIIVDGSEPEDQAEANDLTSILSSPSWTQNGTDVDAIYNGTFSETGTGDNPKGWTRSNNGWGQQVTGLTKAANGVNEGTTTGWYYNNNGAWVYGNDGQYTMPLAGSTTYVLKFKYRKNGNDGQTWMQASVLNEDEEGLSVVQYPGAENGTMFESAEAYFTTGAAGNYTLSIQNNGNAQLTDVSLVKAASATKALSESTDFSMTEDYVYTDVTLTRNFTTDVWNTFVVPFDIDNTTLKSVFGDKVQVAEATLTATSVAFNTMATPAITANKPVIIKGVSKPGPYNFSGVIIKNATPTITTDGTSFVGTYTPQTLADGVYYIASNKLKVANGTQHIKGYRAYFTTSASTRLTLTLDDEETTAIDGISTAANLMNGEVYNLNGMKMTEGAKLQKGIYVVNGKKVIVK